MSYNALKWSYTDSAVLKAGLSSSALAVLRALCWLYKDEGATRTTRNCFPGVARLAAMTGLKEAAVHNAKRLLREKHLISWDRAANMPGRPQRTNNYMIACPKLEKTLKANEDRKRPRITDDDEFDMDYVPPPAPGQLFKRPERAEMVPYIDNGECSGLPIWMTEAIEFVGDSPENRAALAKVANALRDENRLGDALKRVVKTSMQGRKIRNRLGYLLKAIKEEPSHLCREIMPLTYGDDPNQLPKTHSHG